jgi:lysophospholipase L1-like esterase
MPPRKILSKPQQQSYLLATGLATGEHDVLVFKNTEASLGDVQFLGFDFGGGELVSPRVNPHKIELIGDSIAAGSGVDAPNERCAFSPETENAFNAFGAIAARSLGADPIIVAASGRGVVRNADGSTVDTVPVLYTRTLPQYDWSRWDVSEWVPDAVVIDLGTNDFAGGDPGETAFTPAYRGLLETVRKNYPSAHIFCALGAMLEGAELARARDYVKSAIKARSDAGDTKVQYVDMEPLDAKREGLGCDAHPSLRTQRRMAAELVAVMKKTLDW